MKIKAGLFITVNLLALASLAANPPERAIQIACAYKSNDSLGQLLCLREASAKLDEGSDIKEIVSGICAWQEDEPTIRKCMEDALGETVPGPVPTSKVKLCPDPNNMFPEGRKALALLDKFKGTHQIGRCRLQVEQRRCSQSSLGPSIWFHVALILPETKERAYDIAVTEMNLYGDVTGGAVGPNTPIVRSNLIELEWNDGVNGNILRLKIQKNEGLQASGFDFDQGFFIPVRWNKRSYFNCK